MMPDGAWAGFQLSILKSERSGLWTHIATTESDVQKKERERNASARDPSYMKQILIH